LHRIFSNKDLRHAYAIPKEGVRSEFGHISVPQVSGELNHQEARCRSGFQQALICAQKISFRGTLLRPSQSRSEL
jgi:hypothetical protein